MNRTNTPNPWRTAFLVLASSVATAAMLGLANTGTSSNSSAAAFDASGAGNVVVYEQGGQIFIVGPQNYVVMRQQGFKGIEKIGTLR